MPYNLTRSILVVIVPGLVAVTPWAFWFASKMEAFDDIYKTYSVLAHATLVCVAIVVGSIAESALSYLEVRWDKERESQYQQDENWYAYLSIQCSPEPVGFRYISRRVTTLYFELAMMVASPSAFLALAVFYYDNFEEQWGRTITAILAGLALASLVWFYRSAKRTHKLLLSTRKELIARLKSGVQGGTRAT